MILPPPSAPIPANVFALIDEADERIERLQREQLIPSFIPSDFERVYLALRAVTENHLATGTCFCEWGSGLGVNTMLAAMLGFHAGGIEIEPRLINEARQLAADFGIVAEFIHGSFLPEGSHDCLETGEPFAWLSDRWANAPEDAGFDPANIDVFFCYPWSDEETLVPNLFDRHAGDGALLLTYHGGEDLRLRRKVIAAPRKHKRVAR